MLAVRGIVEIGQRLRITRPPWRHWLAERGECLRTDDPGADAGQEVLGQERAERLIFPRLDVSRRPVVEQAETGDVIACFPDRNRLPELVAFANPDAQLQLIVEAAARAM